MTDNNNRSTLKEAFDTELMKRLEENPPEIPTYEEFSAMVDKSLAERCRRRKRIAGIAAGFVVVLLAGILACTNLTADVDADKNPKEEIITEDGVIIEDGGWGSSEYEDNVWMTEDWREVEGARVVVPKILIPKYIPKDYSFEKLIVETVETGAATSEYVFMTKKAVRLEIEIFITNNDMISINMDDVSRELESTKGKVYIKDEDTKIATVQMDNGIVINIWHDLSDQELIKVINSLD